MAERERIQTELDNLRDVTVADRRRLTTNITVSDADLVSDMDIQSLHCQGLAFCSFEQSLSICRRAGLMAGAATLGPHCNVQKQTAEFVIDSRYLCGKLPVNAEPCAFCCFLSLRAPQIRACHMSHVVCVGEL